MYRIKNIVLSFGELYAIILILLFTVKLSATTYTVNSVSSFNALSLVAGDVVIWEDGVYNDDDRIKFLGNGTAAAPITLVAETPGGVVFTNGLKLNIAGSYLIVDGFYWKGGYGASNFIQFRDGTNYAQYCTIQNCAIDGLQVHPDDFEVGTSVKHRWIVLYGNYNNVLNCTFMNKSNAGAMVLVEMEYNALANRCAVVGHIIANNYFYNFEKINTSLTNAGDSETIRVGTSEYQNVDGQVKVNNNYFVQADGENEIITNKSSNNFYQNNTFRRCRGSLVLRHGPRATVDGNYFLGENVEGTGGIRIVDSEHIISNNYIQDCVNVLSQAKWNNGFTFMGGGDSPQYDCASTSVSNGYQASQYITILGNTIVNTNAPLFYNTDKGSNSVSGFVSHNLIYFANGNPNISNVISGDQTNSFNVIGSSLTYTDNHYDGTNLGVSASGFVQSPLVANPNGEIYDFPGSGIVGANMNGRLPITDVDVSNAIGACFLDASGILISNPSNCTVTIPPPVNSLAVGNLSQFTASSQTQAVAVTSNVSWTASTNDPWISISPSSGSNNGTINVTVASNTLSFSRVGTITVSGGGFTRTVSVNQAGVPVVNPNVNNLALNQPVFGTGTPDGANVPGNITDDDTVSRWSVSGFPQSATIDLGAVYNLDATEVVCYQNRAYQYTIEVATNPNGPWTQIVNRLNNTTPGTASSPITDVFSLVPGRYARITVTGANTYTGSWVSLTEVRIFGYPLSNCPTSLVLSGDMLSDESLSASQTIISTQVIRNSSTGNYTAGDCIELNSGFEVQNGSVFSALIQDCN